jgi:hypothetical protein
VIVVEGGEAGTFVLGSRLLFLLVLVFALFFSIRVWKSTSFFDR